jgi:hypothetical protein
MKIVGWVVAALMLALVIGGAKQAQDAEQFWKERDGRRAIEIGKLQADVAQLTIAAKKVSQDVRRDAGRTVTLRDSVLVRLTDTLLIQEFVYRTDTLRLTCLRCAATLDSLRLTTGALQDSMAVRMTDAVQFAEAAGRRQKRQRWLTYGAFIGGAVLGAWLRGQP